MLAFRWFSNNPCFCYVAILATAPHYSNLVPSYLDTINTLNNYTLVATYGIATLLY